MSARDPPPAFPDPATALSLAPEQLPAFFAALAAPANYALTSTPSARARLTVALYSWALDPNSDVRHLFLPAADAEGSEASVTDDWSLSSAQAAAAAASSASGGSDQAALGDEYAPSRRGKPCGHVFRSGESVYRCRDCGLDATCVLCARCFHASSHLREGHDVTVSTHAGVGAGCCDCGDREAWKERRQTDCRYHGTEGGPHPAEDAKGKGKALEEEVDPELREKALRRVRETFGVALDWALDVLEQSPEIFAPPASMDEMLGLVRSMTSRSRSRGRAPSPFALPVPAEPLPHAAAGEAADITAELDAQIQALHRARGLLSEAAAQGGLLNALAGEGEDEEEAPEADEDLPLPPGTVAATPQERAEAARTLLRQHAMRQRLLAHAAAASSAADEPRIPGSFPSPSAFSSSVAPPPAPEAAQGPWSITLWNDEKHSFTQVIDQVSRAVGCSRRAAGEVAQRVDTVGRDVVLISHDAREVLRAARKIAEIDLAVTVRRADETWAEQLAAFIVGPYARDLAKARFAGEAGGLAELVTSVWLDRAEGRESRWMRLAKVESRLWKAPRKEVQEGAVGIMGVSSEVRAELGLQFASIYPDLASSYLLTDREPEHSLIFLGVQVFTVPSLSSALLSSSPSFFTTMLEILYAFFTQQLSPSGRVLNLPPSFTPGARVKLEGNPLFRTAGRRYFHLFSDLAHLLGSPAARQALVDNPQLLEQFAEFLALFEGMNPQLRQTGAHVEYENDTWVQAFNVSIQLARVVKTFGEAYSSGGDGAASPEQLVESLRALLPRVSCALGDLELHRVSLLPATSASSPSRESYPIPLFVPSSAPSGVSYHHSLSWLWAEAAKGLVRVRGAGGLGEMLGASDGEGAEKWMGAVEVPLRTLALVAQVRSGVWVRNGFGIRAQNLHYKEYTLRETTYDQDVFFLQVALTALDPALVVAAIVDRFELVDWLVRPPPPISLDDAATDYPHPSYEPDQAVAMTDELLQLLLVLVTDPVWAAPLSPSAALRRELIHYLALGPSVYSDLLKRLSDRFADDPNIDRLLAQVARFKPPTGSNDQGTYSLRDECFAEVEPYFSRYTRNQREEAEKIVKQWLKRNGKGERARGNEEPLVLPRKLAVSDESSGPFAVLPATLAARPLLLTVLHALRAATTRGEKLFSEQVADAALQLALVAYVEQPEALVAFAVEPVGGGSLAEQLVRVEEDDRLAAVAVKAQWLLDRLVDAHGDAVQRLRKGTQQSEEDAKQAAQLEADAKRAAAKARQAAIMKQFQQAQSAFLQNVEDEDDAEDEDEELDGGEAKMQDAPATAPRTNFGSCIVCQDELDDSGSFGILALVQGSSLIRLTPAGETNVPFQEEVLSLPPSLDRDASHLRPFGVAARKLPVGGFTSANSDDGLARGFPQSTKSGIHASSCGHMMHLSCFERYCRSLEQRHQQQPTRCHPENLERREFTCPLCKSLGNVLLPAETDAPAFLPFQGSFDTRSLADWAKLDADPLNDEDSWADGGTLGRFDENFLHRVDKLSLLNDLDHQSSFKPWRATMALPVLLPEHFNEAEGRMTARLLQVVTALQSEIYASSSSTHTATLSKDVMGYTVAALEVASRGTAEPAWQLSDANVKLLQSLVSVMQSLADLMTQSFESQRIAAVSTRQRLGGLFAQGSKFADVEFTLFDPLGAVIEAGTSMPSAFYHAVAVAFYTSLAQAFLGVYKAFHQSASIPDWQGAYPSPEADEYLSLEAVRAFFPPEVSPALFDPGRIDFRLTLGKHLHAQMLVFLRRAAIVARIVLGEPGEEATDAFMDDEERSEFARLVEFLRIPPPEEVLRADSSISNPAILTLRTHLTVCRDSIVSSVLYSASPAAPPTALAIEPAVDRLLNSSVPDLEHPVVYELLGLPHQLDTLVAASLERQCRRCGSVPTMPALCLFCGEMVCCQSFCCMVGEEEAANGECNEHMWTCGGSVGIYYLVKRNAILYLHTDKGAFSTPPYLDSHGEVDVAGRRSRSQFPQYLHRSRYDEVRKLWLAGTIPTFVARKLEATTDHGGWTTF
ncbi:hypothetical protein JCM10213_006906 [Rhodosporidiobolus nylandii]